MRDMKSMIFSLIIFSLFFFFASINNDVSARNATICSGGFCLAEGQTCSTGNVVQDFSCHVSTVDTNYTDQACCPADPALSPEQVCIQNCVMQFPQPHTPAQNRHCTDLCLPPPDPINILQGPTNETFDTLNPLRKSPFRRQLSTPGGIVSRLLIFIFPAAGLVLFVMLVWGGFEVLIGGFEKKSLDAGKQRITAAIVGFLLLFASYWIMQIVEYVFGLVIF
jgi:hypothetical protein